MRKRKKILFLTNNENTTVLFKWLEERETAILSGEKITLEQLSRDKPDWIVSYNYKHIIDKSVIGYMMGRIINLHISYLPWNRGANPNIWSFIDDTPKGVTIHQINEGLDAGRILYQKECQFDTAKETFISTYNTLNVEIVQLFQEHWEEIREGKAPLIEQKGPGSYHKMNDLKLLKEKMEFEWSDSISDFLSKYHKCVTAQIS